MSRLNYKLVSIILLVAAIVSFSGAIFPVIEVQAVSGESFYNFTRDLTGGSTGDDVKALQQFLNSHGAQVSANGPGSLGNETTYFGKATKTALTQWQTANSISSASGYFGPKTRSVILTMTGDPILKPIEPIQSITSNSEGKVSLPSRLKIPSININATIEYVGLTPDGAMDVPKSPHNVAWYNLGPRPGENGSAVIAGHYGFKKGSVFDNLHKLRKGNKLYIQDENGRITTFMVREILKYDSKADALDVFDSSDGKAHLNLITCEGIWDKVSRNYSKRLVIFTDKE